MSSFPRAASACSLRGGGRSQRPELGLEAGAGGPRVGVLAPRRGLEGQELGVSGPGCSHDQDVIGSKQKSVMATGLLRDPHEVVTAQCSEAQKTTRGGRGWKKGDTWEAGHPSSFTVLVTSLWASLVAQR